MRDIVAAAARISAAAGLTVLGAGVVVGRSLIGLVSGWLPQVRAGAPEPRHRAGRVHEQVEAAQRAARAAGVLRHRS